MKPLTEIAGELAIAQLWQVTAVIVLAGILTRLACRRRPHLAYLIWLVVLIKCLTPPLWSSPTGVFCWMPQGDQRVKEAQAESSSRASDIELPSAAASDRTTAVEPETPLNAPESVDFASAHVNRAASSPVNSVTGTAIRRFWPAESLAHWLWLAWAIGAVAVGGLSLSLAVRCWRTIRRSQVPSDAALDSFVERLASRLGMRRRPRLAVIDEPLGPLTFGWLRPTIVVPQALVAGRSPEELEPILAHELAHVRRGDTFAGLLQTAAHAVWWFHPLVWWAGRQMSRERERSCDEEVLAGLSLSPSAYARSLVSVLELKAQLRWLPAVPGLRRFEVTKQRLEYIMRRSAVFRGRMPRVYWLFSLVGILLLVPGARLARSTDSSAAAAIKPDPPAARGVAARPDNLDLEAARLMKGVYDSFAWIERARSFRIHVEYKTRPTEEAIRYDKEHPLPIFGGAPRLDPRTYCLDTDWAWEPDHIRYAYENYYEGETIHGRQTRTWDGTLAVDAGEPSNQTQKSYVLDNKHSLIFSDFLVTRQLMLPWGPGGPYNFWWLPTDVPKFREGSALAPEDFKRVGEESIDGKPCHLLESRAGGYRMDVGVADGRLYRRTWLLPFGSKPGSDASPAFRKVAGPDVRTYEQYQRWFKSLNAVEQAHASHRLTEALAELSPPKRVVFHETFSDYREVAPGCWLPYRQTVDHFNVQSPEPFLDSHAEQLVTQVAVDQALPKDLFQTKLKDGVAVTTDWRYDPPLRYTYRGDQTEAQRIALRDAERIKRDKGAREWEQRKKILNSRLGSEPLPLPKAGWLQGGPLSWDSLRGKVVVLHFWEVGCGPCRNDLPYLVQWHRDRARMNIVVIGIHPPTADLDRVRKYLAEFNANYPVLIDAPSANPKGIGLVHDWFGDTWWPSTVVIDKSGRVAAHGRLFGGDIGGKVRELAAATPDEVEFTSATITGRVTDTQGNPLSGAKVVWNKASGLGLHFIPTSSPAMSDKNGLYKLTVQFERGETPVIHEMFADLDGYVRGAPLLELTLSADKETTQDFRLEKGEPIEGVVHPPKGADPHGFPRLPPESPVWLVVSGPNLGPRPYNAQHYFTDKNGHFKIDLPQGEYTLAPAMYPPGSKEWKGIRTGQRDLALELPEWKPGSNKTRASGPPPQIVEAIPKPGQTKVSADLKEIRVTFDRDMQHGMSWTGGPPNFPPLDPSRKAHWIDARTCVLPVKLEEGRYYRLGINSTSHRNFRSVGGVPAAPSSIYFTTVGASAEIESRVRAPKIVKLEPANGAADVDPATSALRVTFDMAMDKGMSWTGGGSDFPKIAGGSRAHWLSDGKTCVFPVSLEPGHTYRLGLNSRAFKNFGSEWGVPLEPEIYEFKTR